MKFEALRPERWRFERLIDVYEAVLKAGNAVEAGGSDVELGVSIWEFSDLKGDFSVIWCDEAAARRYHHLVDEAWQAVEPDFESILHKWEEPELSGKYTSFETEGPDAY